MSRNNCKKNRRGCIKNPFTGRWIKKNGQTAKNVLKGISSLQSEGEEWARGKGEYQNVRSNMFCGPAGGAPQGTYPVNTEKRCRAALSYARHAPKPNGIRKCAIRIAQKEGWQCGTSSQKLKNSNIKPSKGNNKNNNKRRRRRRNNKK